MQIATTMDSDNKLEMEITDDLHQGRLMPGLALSILILSLLIAIGVKLADPSTLPVRNVSVTGDFIHLSPVSLQKRVSEVVRGGFFNINVETIQDTLMEEPWVRNVSVNRKWPDGIVVNIREKIAIAQWGDKGLLSSDAKLFYPDVDTYPENQPIVRGPENSVTQIMQFLLKIQKVLPENLSVHELSLSDRRSWRLTLNNGLVLRLGKENIVGHIEQFFTNFGVSGIHNIDQINYVDMRYTNGFVIRLNTENNPDFNSRQENYGKKI
jgi:cell division protein FtsQ